MEENKLIYNAIKLKQLEGDLKSTTSDVNFASKGLEVNNPYKSVLTITKWKKMKIAVLCFLFPVRLLCLMTTFVLGNLLATIFLLGYKESDPAEPIVGLRRVGQNISFALAGVVRMICGFYHVNVKGRLSPEARIIVAAPHSSFMDAVIVAVLGRFNYISGVENLEIPILGNAFRLHQPTVVIRTDKASRSSVTKEIIRRANVKGWPPTLIFPEGTTTNGKTYTLFKAGAFYPGLPVQPVVVRYLDCGVSEADYATWTWKGPGALTLLFVMLSRVYNRAEVEVLPIYVPSREEIDDPFKYAQNVRAYVAKLDRKPTADLTFEDARLSDTARKLNLPIETGLVEYHKINRLTGMRCNDMIECLKEFARINRSCDGFICFAEFCSYLNLPPKEEAKSIFRIFDINNDRVICFQEYLLALFLTLNPFNTDENILSAFRSFALDTDGNYTLDITYKRFLTVMKCDLNVENEYTRLTFDEMDPARNGSVNYEQFKSFCLIKPEFSLLFTLICRDSK